MSFRLRIVHDDRAPRRWSFSDHHALLALGCGVLGFLAGWLLT